mgnify:CR=1 FL=1
MNFFNINTLFTKIFLIIISIFGFTLLIYIFSLIEAQKSALYNSLYSQGKTIARSVELATADALITNDYSFIVEHNIRVIENNKSLDYILVSKNEKENLLIHKKMWTMPSSLPFEINAVRSKEINDKILKTSLFKNEVLHLSYPVSFSGVFWGWIEVGLSTKNMNEKISSIYRSSLYTFLFTLFSTVLFSYILAKWITNPIEKLSLASREIALGKFNVHIDINRKDEIGKLSSNFLTMSSKLKEYTSKLENSKEHLEEMVALRTEELNKKSEELQKLNESLDQKIKVAIETNSKQEQILVQQSRHAAMGEMIGNIAHQWRQPLNAIGLLLQNIESAKEMDMLDDEYIQRVVKKGNTLTNNMSKTIDDFRDFFKPNKEREKFTLYNSYESARDIISSSLTNSSIEIIEDIDKDLMILGYQNELSQVLLNIISNAKDALNSNNIDNKIIKVKIYKEEDKNYIKISDNANGIPTEIIDKIFDLYFSTKEEGKGTGIGLYMSKTIVESNMNGKLSVKNNDEGAEFTIEFL